MKEVTIEYCVPCGLLSVAEEAQQAIESNLGSRLDDVRLVPGKGGVFKVSIDNEAVFDKARDAFDVETIVQRVAAKLRN